MTMHLSDVFEYSEDVKSSGTEESLDNFENKVCIVFFLHVNLNIQLGGLYSINIA